MRSLLFALALGLAAPTAALAEPAPAAPDQRTDCFASNTWQGWSAPGEGDVLYLRVHLHDVYRVDLAPGSHVRKGPDRFLINRVRGSDWICGPLDLDLTLSDHHGFRQPVIARGLHRLTPEEIAAIPPKDRPS